MIFLFEQFAYKPGFLEKVLPQREKGSDWNLPKGFVQRESKGLCKLDGVGYLYNANCKYVEEGQKEKDPTDRIVFVLPKVFLDESGTTAFGQKISADVNFKFDKESKEVPKEFLSNLSLWVCSSIGKYRLSNPADNSIGIPEAPEVRHFDSSKATPSLIDVMNAMKLFYAENQNLFVFTAKNKHSGNNRIDWRRTVVHTQPFMQGDTPIYMELENKKKVFDLDDRLLVLYFSAMHYIEETFGFKMPHSEFYAPMRVNEFRRLLGHRGLVELRRIKHKYFADKFLRLYNIVKAFFEWGGNFSASDYSSEYLLTSKYNNVFEAMIDKLVGDESRDIDSLKQNDDGKIIDHLYKEKSLVFASGTDDDLIWHIGDSKYYQDPSDIQGQSVAKQFTYAKNVMQNFFNTIFYDNANVNKHKGVRYRDDITEGYSVTPNFFIRGELPAYEKPSQFKSPYFFNEDVKEVDYKEELIKLARKGNGSKEETEKAMMDELWEKRNRHFPNRLFDRDTLLLQTYDVNFLYVLKAYTSKRSSLRQEFKDIARSKFRENFLSLLDKKYVFYALWPKTEDVNGKKLENSEKYFVNKHFRILVGKIFKPAGFGCLILALEQSTTNDADVKEMWNEIEGDCNMIARVTPREIWEVDTQNLPEANFEQSIYDESFHGFFIKREIFEREEIGKKHRLPSQITNRPIAGNAFLQIGFAPNTPLYSDKNEYYFLPCK
ncbi:LlaJI family restriction endonuclease [uncultured Fibrobacter sp.]|uniref:LlaJI family restriction endonuclease n=1 Tax=uncultured Fibrobacter sp. TaxID=261512 RepID=UPI0025E840B4|nr:LlaJI family restriction endonuclease [uncultured Fibrobacter sp.]